MGATIVIDPRYCGPPECGNGGYVVGSIAQLLEGAVEATLAAPTPLSVSLDLEHTSEGAVLRDGATVLVRAERRALAMNIPEAPTRAAALAAMPRYAGFARHSFSSCFVCSVQRQDGLRIFAGPVEGRDLVAAVWTPGADLADEDGVVREAFLWAALDCPGYFTTDVAEAAVLGRLHGAIVGEVRAGEDVVVAAWPIERKDRKFSAGSALFAADGRLVAKAQALWIEVSAGGRFTIAAS